MHTIFASPIKIWAQYIIKFCDEIKEERNPDYHDSINDEKKYQL